MRKLLNIFFKSVLILLCLLITTGIGIYSLLSSSQGQRYVIGGLTPYLEKLLDADISIDSVEFILPFGLRVNQGIVKKNGSLIAAFADCEVRTPPLRWLDGELVIPYFEVNGLSVDPTLFNVLNETHYFTQDLSLLRFDLAGHLTTGLHDKTISARGVVTIVDESGSKTPIALSIDSKEDHADLMIHIHDIPLHLLEAASEIPNDSRVELMASVHLPLMKLLPINGDFSLFTTMKDLKTSIHGDYQLKPDLTLLITDMDIKNNIGNVNSSLTISYEEQLIDAEFKGDLHSLSLLESLVKKPLNGSLNFAGSIKGSLTDPEIDLSTNSLDLEINEQEIGDFSTHFLCQWRDNRVELRDILVSLPSTGMSGHLTIYLTDYLLDGEFISSIEDMSLINRLVNTSLEGSADIQIKLAPDIAQNSQSLQCKIAGKEIKWQDVHANDISAFIQITNLWAENDIHLTVESKYITKGIISLDTFRATSKINITKDDSWPFSFEASGPSQDYNIVLLGSWHADDDEFRFNIDSGHGSLVQHPFQLMAPSAFRYNPQTIELTPVQLSFDDTLIEAVLTANNDHLSASFNAHKLPASLFHYLYPELHLLGECAFEASLSGTRHDPHGAVRIDLKDIKIAEKGFEKIPPIQSTIQMDLNKDRLSIDGTLSGLGSKAMMLKGTLPVAIAEAPSLFKIDRKAPINLYLTAEGDIEPILNLFFIDSAAISGKVGLMLTLEGTIESPQFKGTGILTDGSYENFSSGAAFKDIRADLLADGSKITLTHITAADGDAGSIQGTGTLNLEAPYRMPFEVNLEVDNASLIQTDTTKIIASGQARLIGDKDQSTLSGKLNIDKAKISIPEELPTQIKSVEVTIINRPANQEPKQKEPVSWPLNLDLNLIVPSTLSISGKGLSSKWAGEMVLSGTLSNPLYTGELHNVQGEYDFNGKHFEIEQGVIQFAGALDKKTTLYVLAGKDIDRIKAEVILKGSIDKPVLAFRSNPPMTQKEILSYILFNRGISEINPMQGAQLKESNLTLSSGKQSEDFLGKLRSTIGIDRVDISRSGNEDSNAISLQVGKYISRGIFVSVNKSITAESTSLGIEAALSKFFRVKAEISDDSEDKLLIEWKRDY